MIDAERTAFRFRLDVVPGRPPLAPFLGAVNSAPWRGMAAGTCRLAALVPSRIFGDVVYVEVEYRAAGWQNAAYPAEFNRLDLGELLAEGPSGRVA